MWLGVQQTIRRESTDTDDGLKRTDIHDVLRNDRRRRVLSYLRDSETPVSVRDLSEHIATIESGESPAPRNVRQSVYVSLHQTHLPKLDDLGIVDCESTDGVTLAQHADEVTVYLEVVPKHGLSWGEYYLGLGVLGAFVQIASVAGVPIVAGVGTTTLALSFFLLFIVSASYHISTQDSTVFNRFSD